MRTLPIAIAAASLLLTTASSRAQLGVQTPSEIETRASDVFLGQNKKGPYTLAWKNIRSERVTVILDGVTLSPDAYSLDTGKGTISFKTSLKPQSVARIDYGYEPSKAQRNANPASQPITVPVLNLGDGGTRLQMTALPGGNSLKGPLLVWGLENRFSAFGGGLTSQFLLAPDAQGGGGLADRAGMKLGYSLKGDRSRAAFSFQRSGREFAPTAGGSFGMAERTERWSAAGGVNPSRWASADLSLTGSRDLGGNGSSEQGALTLRLWGFGGAPLVTLARVQGATSDASGNETATTTNKAAVSGKAGAASYSVQAQRTETDAANDGNDRAQQDVAASVAAATKDARAQASVEVSKGTTEVSSGEESRDAVTVKTAIKPSSKVALSAQTRVETNDPVQGDATVTRVSAATVDLKPSANIALSAQTRLESREPAEGDAIYTRVTAAKVEVKPFAATKLTGSVTVDDNPDRRLTTSEMNGEARPLRYVSLSGGMTGRQSDRADLLDTQRARLTLQPVAGWSLSGGVVVNPESNGAVIDALRQEYGLQMRVGALQLGGGYALTSLDDPTVSTFGSEYGEFSLNLGLRFSRYTQLTGGFQDAFFWGAPDSRGTRAYSMGLNHAIGSAVAFSLSGTMTEDKSQVGVPADVKAQAQLGLKF